MSRVIRVDKDVYRVVLDARHKLEIATERVVTMGDALKFLTMLADSDNVRFWF